MKKIVEVFFSMLTTGVLLVVFAFGIGYATFIENDYGALTAKVLVYNSWWFEVLLVLLVVNLIGSILFNKLISGKRWAIFLFHFAFIVILAGAAITRYFSFEGTMHIREGEQTNHLITEATYINITTTLGDDVHSYYKEVKFTPYTKTRFSKSISVGGKEIKVTSLQFVPAAIETLVDDPAGEPILDFMAVDAFGTRYDNILKMNESKTIGSQTFNFGVSSNSAVLMIFENEGNLFFNSPDTVALISMGHEEMRVLAPSQNHPLIEKTIYRTGEITFVIKRYSPKAKARLISVPQHGGSMGSNALHMRVQSNGLSKDLFVYKNQGAEVKSATTEIDGVKVMVTYGPMILELPVSLRLNDFVLERYPGSNSPSSFASEVTLIDEVHQVEKPYRIYMNNILKYRGYRFFQSSYDQDELGTILSVNYDSVGTAVTYFGYFIMTMGMIFTFFSRSSRFRRLVRSSAKLRLKREQIFAPLLILGLFLSVTQLSAQTSANVVSKEHAREFGKLQVQNIDGRIEPVNTLASEFLRKVAKKNSYEGLTPVQLFLEMTIEPKAWLSAPLIKVSHPDMKKLLGVGGDFASLHNFFGSNHDNSYKLGTLVEQTFEKKPVQRTKFDKEIITVDERVNLLYQMLNGTLLRVFPAPGDDNQKWADLTGILMQDDHTMSDFASSTMRGYSTALITARQTADYSAALEYLNQLKSKQADLGAAIYPSSFKTALEVFYINFNLYSKLSKFYVLAGLILLVLHILVLLKPTLKVKTFTKTGFWVVMALFLVHTAGLGIRWYISGHAPWSNGYETLLYISWSTCLAGLIFAKRSPITLSVTAILSAITLFVAGMSWMNPELTNLVPVLKSFWLIIHVAIITASYGFLGMTALLGLVNLMVMIIRNPLNSTRINLTIKELGFIIEIALIVGLFLLTIGSFLGGVWANESWGRYWGWDPKETWAMVTILVYAFIVHTHKIPGFRGSFALSAFALIGFSSVLMTFFGVNYYLSGLHSYAQGDPPPVPAGVYITAVMVLFIVAMAYLSQRNQQRTGIEMLNGED